MVATVNQTVLRNALPRPQAVFVDEGIRGIADPSENIVLKTQCDSKLISGIQLADFVAYHCSYLLKCSLTGQQEKVFIESEPHPFGGQEVDLDWLVRTDFRRHFFVEYRNIDEIQGDDWYFQLAGYGAFFSDSLSPEIKAAATKTFDSMFFGCVVSSTKMPNASPKRSANVKPDSGVTKLATAFSFRLLLPSQQSSSCS